MIVYIENSKIDQLPPPPELTSDLATLEDVRLIYKS